MKTVTFALDERSEGQNEHNYICVSTEPLALSRHKSECGIRFAYPDIKVMCKKKTYRWIESHQVDEVLVITDDIREEFKKLHFYKEIVML